MVHVRAHPESLESSKRSAAVETTVSLNISLQQGDAPSGMDEYDDGLDISQIARQCKAAFARCAASPTLGQRPWVRSAQGDFNLWCAGINATTTDKSSLDYRLRTRQDVSDTVRDLLQAMVEAIGRCEKLVGEFGQRMIHRSTD